MSARTEGRTRSADRTADGAAPPESAAHLGARVARLLLIHGASTNHALQRMEELGLLLGQPVQGVVTPEAIVVTAGSGDEQRTRVGHTIPAMGVDMARLAAVEQALDGLRTGATTPADLDARLDDAETAPGHPGWLVVLGVALTAAALARIFGADWSVVAAAFAAGLVSTLLRRLFAQHGVNAIAATVATAFASALVAALALRWVPGTSAVFALTAAGMILVPGVPLVNGIRDLVTGHAGVAVARLATGAVTVLSIGLALLLAAALTRSDLPVGEGPGRLPVPEDLLFSALAAIGYSMLFNVPARLVPICMLCGMASHGLRTALASVGVDLFTGSFLGALAAGAIACVAARRFRVPAVTFAFPGIVAMIPGSYGFRAAIGGLQVMTAGADTPPALAVTTLSLVLTTSAMTVAIGVGLALALALLPEHPSPSTRGV